MLLFCPHCDEVIEILGEPRALECACGVILERVEVGSALDAALDAGERLARTVIEVQFAREFPIGREGC